MQPKFKLIICEEKENFDFIKNKKIENYHDKLFKNLLTDKEEFKNFLYDYTKFDIRFKEIEKCTNSYISNNYKAYEADIVYKVKNENIYILLEHQSTIDERMPYRMLNYCTEIFEEVVDLNKSRNKKYEYPLIIPIVLYTGKRSWNVETNFSSKIKNSNGSEKYIEMKYELIDINNYSEQELLKRNTAISYVMLIEKNKEREELIETLNKISHVSKDEEVNKKLVKIMQNILQPILKDSTDIIIKKFNVKEDLSMEEIQRCFMKEWNKLKEEKKAEGLKEGLEEGMKKGIQEGKKEGKKEGIKIIILNMIKNKLDIEKIKEYTGIEEDEIKKIVANM